MSAERSERHGMRSKTVKRRTAEVEIFEKKSKMVTVSSQ